MMAFAQNWIRSLVAASAAAALAKQFTPNGPVKKVTEFACGVMLMAVLLSPLVTADTEVLALAMSDYRRTAAELTRDLEDSEKQLLRLYIEQQCAAYILDEAQTMGMEDLRITVKTKWRDESWVPYEAFLETAADAVQRARLSAYMESELGISAERQHWNG